MKNDTPTLDKLKATGEAVIDHVADSGQHVEHMVREALLLKTRTADLLEDSLHKAKRTVKRGMQDVENLRDETVVRVRRTPLTAVGTTFAAGLLLGVVVGWISLGRRRA